MITAWQRVRITAIMAVAFSAEHADQLLLSAMYLAISRSLHVTVSQLGTLSMWRALVQAFAIPLVGIAGNMYNRVHLIGAGTVLWGAMSVGMGFSKNYSQAAAWCALNGVGLALALPCVQSIIADVYRAKSRGKAFGLLFTISACGGMVVSFLAITFSQKKIAGQEGWRFIWFCVAGVAAIAMVAVFTGGIEPRNLKPKEVDPGRGRAGHQKPTFWQAAYKGIVVILSSTKTVFRIRSFQIILLAGTVGSVAVMGMGYKIMYFQLLGFSDIATATLSTCTTLGLALGFLMGGAFGDALAVRFPNTARPFINQLSVALAGPFTIILFKAMPGCSKYATGVPGSLDKLVPEYGFLLFAIGALASWPASNNAAIFAEVVPEAVRSSVYAFDKCIVGAIGAISTPLAGLLAEHAFGFTHNIIKDGHAAATSGVNAPHHLNNARALENGLLSVMLAPMFLQFLIYFGLYWTLPHDRIDEDKAVLAGSDVLALKGGQDVEIGKGGQDDGACSLPDGMSSVQSPAQLSLAGRRCISGSMSGGSLHSSTPISREVLRAGLEKQVLATALDPELPSSHDTIDEDADARVLARQGHGSSPSHQAISLTAAVASIARKSQNLCSSLSAKLSSGSVGQYITLEMTPGDAIRNEAPKKKESV